MRSISESIRDESRGRGNADGPFSSQPLWAVAILPIFRVAHSLPIDSDMLVVRALKIGKMVYGGMRPTYDSMH